MLAVGVELRLEKVLHRVVIVGELMEVDHLSADF